MKPAWIFFSCMLCSAFARTQPVVLPVDPALTSKEIRAIHGPHIAMRDTSVQSLHRLFLMIVGTGGQAKDNYSIDSFAATKGYHVLSLDYPNNVITTTCSNSEDSTCFDRFRAEIVLGAQVSSLVDVDVSNSIYNRLVTALKYLSAHYPKQGWNHFIRNGQPQWQKIIIAGHSQGAGHAAYLGKMFAVKKVILLAGPQDYLVLFHRPAGWQSLPSKTPYNRFVSFLHANDPFDFNRQLADDKVILNDSTLVPLEVFPGKAPSRKASIYFNRMPTANPHGSMLLPVFSAVWADLLGT
jgi:pimeloyl-ACP methyl ester carboxylesterase